MYTYLPFRSMTLAAIVASTLGGYAQASSDVLEQSICGHVHHESLEMRNNATTRVFWQDERAANERAWVQFKILGFNDFHGQLEPRSLFGRPVGGAAVMASYLQSEAAASKNGAILVHAGDHVGATPPVSALLQDEPAISFLNMLGNRYCGERDDEHHHGKISVMRELARREHRHEDRDEHHFDPRCNIVGTLGNHEFDEGVTEMLRMINGGIHKNGPFLDADYHGADFPYVVSNVVWADSGEPILPPYVIKTVRGLPVAFIGAVLKGTPNIVTPSGVAGVRFLDEAEAINRYVPELKRKGVRAIVVNIHQGTRQNAYAGDTHTDAADIGGDIAPIINELDDEIDIVIAGHWHQFTNALVSNKNGKLILVTQAYANSTAYSNIDVAIDPASRDIVMKSAQIVTTWGDQGPGLTPNAEVAQLVSQAADAVAPLVNRVIGNARSDILRDENDAGESALGNLIADAQRAAMGTDVAFMNAGGIRADLFAGDVTWGELFTIQPFGNDLVSMNLSGQQIVDLLNQQWQGQTYARILKPSGISYRWSDGDGDAATLNDNSVVVDSIMINGSPIDLAASYSVTVNSFIAAGGDYFSVLPTGTNRVIGTVDLQALVDYVQALPQPFSYQIEGRIGRQ